MGAMIIRPRRCSRNFCRRSCSTNPKYQRAAGAPNLAGLPPGDPDFAKRLQDYQKNLQFNIDQQQNKLVPGRTGVAPDGPGARCTTGARNGERAGEWGWVVSG